MQIFDFLKEVEAGKQVFQTEGSSIEELSNFQNTVKKAKFAYSQCFVENFKPHKESETSQSFIDFIIFGKITQQGLNFLKNS